MRWNPHPDASVQAAIERVLRSWEDTPYESGQRMRGLGADCIGSVFGAIDGVVEFSGLRESRV